MNSNEDQVRAAIAEQAGEWFVANDAGALDTRDSAALTAWFRASPVHVEEFLGVSAIARDLEQARTDPEYSLEAILARVRSEDVAAATPILPQLSDAVRGRPSRRWLTAAVMAACFAVLSVGLLLMWNVRSIRQPTVATTLHFETRHGEQITRRLADNSVLHLNTDSAVNIRYGKYERLITLSAGEAAFEVVHDPARAFRVIAGSAQVVDVGTQFDVRLGHDSTVVTVVEGSVAVANLGADRPSRSEQLGADQQIRFTEEDWPATPIAVDAQRTTAWLRREIVFDHEPLEQVAAEYNRYAPKPIEIATPALRNLQISGVFATDDTEAFIAFLRSLKGVRVEVTATHIRISGD